MALIGNIIKGALAISSEVEFNFKSDIEKQRATLKGLLESAQNTSFGKYYDFRSILHRPDIMTAFRERVPIFDYDQMYSRWWKQQLQVEDITWPGRPEFYARSSGTTGSESKRIPITSDFISSTRKVSFDLLKKIPGYNLPDEVFESEVLIISSSASLSSNEQGQLEGEISGINIYNLPDWYDMFYRPGKEIAQISDWHERLQRIVKEAPGWNIGAIAGIPSWVLQVLKAIINEYNVPSIKAIWPNLTVYASGGVAFDTYEESFRRICGEDLVVLDTYLASEGFFSFTDTQDSMDMLLALEHGFYYEFVPFNEKGFDRNGDLLENPEVIDLRDVELQKEYALLVTTCSGAWRYMIGDTIKFTSLNPHRIVLTGRTKFFLNVTGSQLSEEKLDDAITFLGESKNVEINEYSVGVLKDENDRFYHQWVLVSDDEIDEDDARSILDERLKDLNHNYKVARGKALHEVKVKRLSKNDYLDWMEGQKKLGGQVKTPKVMKSDKMKAFVEHIDK